MTFVGWLQIAVFMTAIGLLTHPLGGYLARVYSGQRELQTQERKGVKNQK